MTNVAQMYEPPLLRFMRALDPDAKEAFAESAGTSLQYLHQMIGQTAPNPNLKMALAIVAESQRIYRKSGIDPLTLEDLLVGRIKVQSVKDHTTGEAFTLLENGKLARRRIDKQGRIVLIDDHGGVIAVEDSHPGPNTVKKILPLE